MTSATQTQENTLLMARRSRLTKLRDIVRQGKDKPCMDCKKTYHYSNMSYDHVRGKKKFNLGGSLRGLDEVDVRREMDKCDVVCLMCHAERERLRREARKKT